MAEESPHVPRSPNSRGSPGRAPLARLELRHGSARPLLYEVSDAGFLIGSVPGCDLRLPGADLPPLLCLLAPREQGLGIRKLVPAYLVELNGQPLSSAVLSDGDRVTLGSVELIVRLASSAGVKAEAVPALAASRDELAERQRQLAARAEEVESRSRHLDESQRQLYQRYRARRGRLAGLQEAVALAGRKVQEGKRQLESETQRAELRRQEDDRWRAELTEREQAFAVEVERRTGELDRERERQEEQRRLLESQRQEWQSQYEERQAECDRRGRQLEEERAALAERQGQYQEDLVRLHRLAAALDERQQQLEERGGEVENRFERLHQESKELEEQARQVAAWRADVRGQAERLAGDAADLDVREADLERRMAALEGQQDVLAALRGRWERACDQVQREEQELVERRGRLEESEADVRAKMRELRRLRDEFAAEREAQSADHLRVEEQWAAVATALVYLEEWQEEWAGREERQRQRAGELDGQATRLAEAAGQLQERSVQVAELQDRLGAERQALREREAALAQAEMGQEALQEQLRRRSEELAERQRALADREQLQAEADSGLDAVRAEWRRERQLAEEQWAALRQDLDSRGAALTQATEALQQREEALNRHIDRLKESGRALAQARKELSAQRAAGAGEQERAETALAAARAEFDALRQEAATLQRQLPHWETHSRTAAEHLQRARDQLRGHLGELHAYARQAGEDLEALRSQARAEAEKARQQGLLAHRARDEHRLAVAAFRQQLIDWQGQVAELKRTLSQDQTRLERRHAEVEATSLRLAEQAEKLQAQERDVSERRGEMERHLDDMREWYRRKLRELTGRFHESTVPVPADGASRPALVADAANQPTGAAGILALTGDIDPGDRQLGDLLRSLELVDADTLARLLVEARKQRQSLRQVLLASGYVTLFQMALIEAGNLDGLMLGPVRVMDRLRATARETVYRVFDPRRASDAPGGGEGYAILRHLAEAEMEDAVHPDEFRQRFAAASRLQHPNLAATLEVLDVHGRPAALQEWVNGLAAPDWPALYTASGVWLRLVQQAAQGLHAAHQAGLLHGHLHPSLLLLNTEGILKIGGLGEPLWLADPETVGGELNARDDLATLGEIALTWATAAAGRRKGAKVKPLAEPLPMILERLTAAAPEARYPDTAALLEDLERAAGDVPPNPEAWDRLIRHVRAHVRDDRHLRQSA